MQLFLFQYLAQITNPRLSNTVSNLHPTAFFNRIIPTFINIGLVIGVIGFVFILILGGINWITSAGDKGKVEGARSKITQALTGLAVLAVPAELDALSLDGAGYEGAADSDSLFVLAPPAPAFGIGVVPGAKATGETAHSELTELDNHYYAFSELWVLCNLPENQDKH